MGLFYLKPVYASLTQSSNTVNYTFQFMDDFAYHEASGIVVGQWHHFAMVKTQGEYSVYLDGTLQFTDSLPTTTDGEYTSVERYRYPRIIGKDFRGWIDEFRVSNEALSPSQFLNYTP